MTKTGAVYCSTMALAAVVSLLASVYRVLVPQTLMAPSAIQRLNRTGWWVRHRNPPITSMDRMFRPLLMLMAFHGITLMHSPPML